MRPLSLYISSQATVERGRVVFSSFMYVYVATRFSFGEEEAGLFDRGWEQGGSRMKRCSMYLNIYHEAGDDMFGVQRGAADIKSKIAVVGVDS